MQLRTQLWRTWTCVCDLDGSALPSFEAETCTHSRPELPRRKAQAALCFSGSRLGCSDHGGCLHETDRQPQALWGGFRMEGCQKMCSLCTASGRLRATCARGSSRVLFRMLEKVALSANPPLREPGRGTDRRNGSSTASDSC